MILSICLFLYIALIIPKTICFELKRAKAIIKNENASINEATKATFSVRIDRLEGISLFAPTIPKLNSNKMYLFRV
jgi:hypothetical protein